MFIRSHAVRDLTLRREWETMHPYCQACGHPGNEWERCLETHHICKLGRSDEATNLLRLCQRDHHLAEGLTVRRDGAPLPLLTFGICLALKALRDPDEFDARRLEDLYHRSLPDLERLPEFFAAEFRQRRGVS